MLAVQIMRMAYAEGLTTPEIEYSEGGIMVDNKTRFADLREMLDSSKENLKMDAMKRVISMVAKGKDCSELFPAVVKNVAAKNLELKKLVYVYLVRYAEEQQELALLSISTFQRGLKDHNQLIRASALRVLSSIRVSMIAPVMMLAIKEAVRDMSAYVRKVAAHAIPKLFSLEPELQPQLIECIDFLLGDKRTLVLGSAVYAFEETCPDQLQLLHKHYRSLCRALVDVDEWGQVIMISLLTRYARTQFVAPKNDNPLDPDHFLLLQSAKPLLQNRNCSVVMAVAQLFYHVAPPQQLSIVSKALVRLLSGPREVQYVVLVNIATICAVSDSNSNIFEPYLKSFFVRNGDSMHVKLLKLQILKSLATESNVQIVLKELQTYVKMNDLAGPAIEAIGHCALQVGAVAELCLTGLVSLIANSNEELVSSVVVVLKKLLHQKAPLSLLVRLLRLINSIKAPSARACVIWLVSTHINQVRGYSIDLLRIVAKTFASEAEIVKLQTLNLAVKLWVLEREKSELLVQYVLQLARYDKSYDVRDRCRFIRNLILRPKKLNITLLLSEKPSPISQSQFKDRELYQLGTLSHLLNQKCSNYKELPEFCEVQPDPCARKDPEIVIPQNTLIKEETTNLNKGFYSSDTCEDETDESDDDEESESSNLDETGDSESDESEDESEDYESEEECNGLQSSNVVINTPNVTKNDMDLLLDLDFSSVSIGIVNSKWKRTSAMAPSDNSYEILSPTQTGDLSIKAIFTRSPSLFSNTMVSIDLEIFISSNNNNSTISLIPLDDSKNTSGPIHVNIISKTLYKTNIGINFEDTVKVSKWKCIWECETKKNEFAVEISAPLGEQVEAIEMSKVQFDSEASKLTGMYYSKVPINLDKWTSFDIYHHCNCKLILGTEGYFAAETVANKQLLLLKFDTNEKNVEIFSENVLFGNLFANYIQTWKNNTR
ncbi:Ruby [Strongyloides ratti]|uniref:AP-3 complex subunit beta n=1 Tax=Strongyloides ratti TaxID=34506 RepID=A0A090LHM6_STRRB|nr:Ruby [Strongyloides ratti]CEF67653.1 Ruby [Strongyloides ratti]